MLVPHGSDATRSISVTERAIRVFLSLVAVVMVTGVIGAASLGWRVGRSYPVSNLSAADATDPAAAVLAGRLTSLKDTLDAIREREARIRLHAGVPPAKAATLMARVLSWGERKPVNSAVPRAKHASLEDATAAAIAADSLIARAGALSEGYADVADSIERRANRGRRRGQLISVHPTAEWIGSALANDALSAPVRVQRKADGVVVVAPQGAIVLAPAVGAVSRLTESASGIWSVDLAHPSGLSTRLTGLTRLTVRQGERVGAGQVLGAVAESTGGAAGFGFELRRGGAPIDPRTPIDAREPVAPR